MRIVICVLLSSLITFSLVACGSNSKATLPQHPDSAFVYRSLPTQPATYDNPSGASRSGEKPFRDIEDLIVEANTATDDTEPTASHRRSHIPDIFQQDESKSIAEPKTGPDVATKAEQPEAQWQGLDDEDISLTVSVSPTPGSSTDKGSDLTKVKVDTDSTIQLPTLTTIDSEESMAQALQTMIVFCESQLKKNPEDRDVQQRLLSLYILTEDVDKAFRIISDEIPDTLDARTNLVSALAFFLEGEVGQGAIILERYLERLHPKLPLHIAKALFVEPGQLVANPQAFGSYTDKTGTPMQAGALIGLYLELDHFTCRRSQVHGNYRVSVQVTAEILDADGIRQDWVPYEEEAGVYELSLNSRIRDLAPSAVIQIPPSLTEGSYTLVAIVKDNLNPDKQPARKKIPFTILHR